MAYTQVICQECNRRANEVNRVRIDNWLFVKLSCGHTLEEPALRIPDDDTEFSSILSHTGYTLYPFQRKVISFIATANGRVLLNLDMGLGKTICAYAFLNAYWEIARPFVILCRANLVRQWQKEAYNWLKSRRGMVQAITSSAQKPESWYDGFIISMDLARNLDWLKDWPAKTVIIDECQHIKNSATKRTVAIREFCEDKPFVMGLSGTPIKNHAGEYFPILNILQPARFHTEASYVRTYCDTYRKGGTYVRIGGLRDVEYFRRQTKDFIIRYTRDEVMPDLPKINRQFVYTNMDDSLSRAYDRTLDEFEEEFKEGMSFKEMTNLLAIMAKMRKITGLGKIEQTVSQVEDFLDNFEGERKIVIFTHHRSVARILLAKLGDVCAKRKFNAPLALTSDIAADSRHEVIDRFRERDVNVVMVASTLASGEGINLQFCSDAIMMERQWNPVNERQAEDRFPRIGSTASQVNITYVVAVGTIDEFLAELIERKRSIIDQTIDGKTTDFKQSQIMKELADILSSQGRKRFALPV